MSKVITFSRVFPADHPKAGEPTYFVEKLVKSFNQIRPPHDVPDEIFSKEMYYICEPKHHTIRSGNRWKAGDTFSPRVWSGKPYQSKQIIIAPDLEVKKTYSLVLGLNSKDFYLNGIRITPDDMLFIAENDGLKLSEFLSWFKYPKPFTGQIICWQEMKEYDLLINHLK